MRKTFVDDPRCHFAAPRNSDFPRAGLHVFGAMVLVGIAATNAAADPSAIVTNSRKTIPVHMQKGRILLDAESAARAFGWKWEIITPKKFGAFCNDAGCVPVRLTRTPSATVKGRLFLDADAVGKALGFQTEAKDGTIRLTPTDARPRDDLPAYNAAWGAGRGFRVGQTLPDIPLTDLEGNEVRFSKFLGRQYIIYCWASW